MRPHLVFDLICIIGCFFPILSGVTSVWVLLWGAFPYILVAALNRFMINRWVVFSCVFLLFLADFSFYMMLQISPRSNYLQLFSLVSTLKFLLILPLFLLFKGKG